MPKGVNMPEARNCPVCGTELPDDSTTGQCVQCLLQLALDAADPALPALPTTRLTAPPAAASPAPPRATGEAAPPSATEKAGDRIGRYKLLQKLGEGGCGVVYLAEQEEPVRRRVALKVIKLGMDTREVIARFEAERQALALMDHPNIAKVLDAGTSEQGRPFFVMELVRGISITRYCDENKLGTRQRLEVFIQVCQAIQHAHQKAIIHRDIKPSNILIADHDGVPVPKVIDFGIAKATAGQTLTDKTLFTAFEQFIGTPAYMSPEQARLSGLDIDTRCDIYSLGVLLYELLTGNTPFDAKRLSEAGLDEVCRIIREEEPPRPSTRLHTLSAAEQTTVAKHRAIEPPKLLGLVRGDLDWIVMKCLEKDRNRRYDTTGALAQELQCYLRNEPVRARPPSTAYRIQRAWRRHKLVVSAAAAVAIALMVGLTVSVWQAVRATKAERQQERLRQAAQNERDHALEAQRLADLERARAEGQRTNAERNLYLANLSLLQQAWDQNNGDRVRELLEETAPYPQRGFEWYYWQRQMHLDVLTLRGQLEVWRVAYSPDGQRILTSGGDRTVKLWEAGTGHLLLTFEGHGDRVGALAFSPDGRRIVTGSRDRRAKVWDAATGKELLTLRGHSDGISSVAFSPDGRRILTGSSDNTAKLWDALSGKSLLTLRGHTNGITSVAFSPDGRWLATASLDGRAKLWETDSGKELLTLEGNGGWILSVAFSPNGQRIATGSSHGTIKVLEAATGRELLAIKQQTVPITSVAFSPDGQRIVTGGWDTGAKVWDAESGRELLVLKGHTKGIGSAVYSPNGQWILTGSDDRTAKVWDANSTPELNLLGGQHGRVFALAFSPNSQRIATAGGDHTAQVWDLATAKELLTLQGHAKRVTALAFSPDGQRIATGSQDLTAKVWDAAIGKPLFTLRGHTGPIGSIAFSQDGRRIVTGGWEHKVWEAATGKLLFTFKGESILVSTGDAGPSFISAAFSPDSRRIVAPTARSTAKVWDADSAKELFTLEGHSNLVCSVEFSPDGQRILTGSADQTAKLWDAGSGRELLTLKGHSGYVYRAVFSPDGQRIATGSADQSIKLWDALTGKELLTFQTLALIDPVAFSPDGRWLAAGGEEAARLWRAASPEEIASWQKAEHTAAQAEAALEQARATREQRRLEEARWRDRFRREAIPPRDAQARANLIDLSSAYNAGLNQSWHQGSGKSDLSSLPQGLQTFAGVEFDVRGLIQVGGRSRLTGYTNMLSGIAIDRSCLRLHFLHAAVAAVRLTNGTPIGRYVVHYHDGQRLEIPLIIGGNLAHWRSETNGVTGPLVPAWVQPDESAEEENRQPARLFKMTWTNPRPEVVVKTIDIESAHRSAAPFLIALTAEP
jgi:WD40 repeat protein/serine/threonine protein kinase